MSNFVRQTSFAEMAAEDSYFAKDNREQIGFLQAQMQTEKNSLQTSDKFSAEARPNALFTLP